MFAFIQNLFDTADFPPRWHCGNWSAALGWMHILSDVAIFGAYTAIPCVLGYFVLRRRDVPFLPIFWLFVVFIFSCGVGHLVEATLFWHPWYRFSGLIKAITALASWATVLALIPIIPKALTLPRLATVNKQLEQEIAERKRLEERFRITLESAPTAMVMINADGQIVLVNAQMEALFGYSRAELMGGQVDMLVPERFRGHHPTLRNGFFAKPETRRMGIGRDLFGLRKDGSEFPVEIGLNPIKTEEGLFVLSAIVDITERKKAEQAIQRYATELEQTNHELEQFVYAASHDLKAPLRAVDHLAHWISEDAEHLLPEGSRHDLGLMRQRLARMQKLLDDLLAYSSYGRKQQAVESVDTVHLVHDVVDLLGLPAGFVVTVGALPTLTTSRTPLEQVFRNLISNAVKHHHRTEGSVDVSAIDWGPMVEFVVKDDGPGIAAEYHERIFQMFQTLKPRDQVEGSGMGLAIVKKIVESQGGTVKLQSTPGNGAAFSFTWPRGS